MYANKLIIRFVHLTSFDVLTSDFVDWPLQRKALTRVAPWLLDWSARFCARSRVWAESRRFASRPDSMDLIRFHSQSIFFWKRGLWFFSCSQCLDTWWVAFVFSHLGKANRTEMKSSHMLDSPIVLLRSFGSVIYTYTYVHLLRLYMIVIDCLTVLHELYSVFWHIIVWEV